MKVGKKQIKGTLKADSWVRIYNNTLSSPATSVTISGLDGDTDVEWILRIRHINGYNGVAQVRLRPNNDSGNNYGMQQLYGENTSAGADRGGGVQASWFLHTATALNDLFYGDIIIYAKSGFVRTMMQSDGYQIAGTTVGGVAINGQSWNNTADNITSLVVVASQTNGLGTGTEISLFARKSST